MTERTAPTTSSEEIRLCMRINSTSICFDVDIIHYASDIPFSNGNSLGAQRVS